MHESTIQDLPHQKDLRPGRFRAVGDALRSSERIGRWQTLTAEELHGLTVPPGDRGVPGPDETRTLLEGLNKHNKTLRDACHFEARLVGGEHQVRYASALDPSRKTGL